MERHEESDFPLFCVLKRCVSRIDAKLRIDMPSLAIMPRCWSNSCES